MKKISHFSLTNCGIDLYVGLRLVNANYDLHCILGKKLCIVLNRFCRKEVTTPLKCIKLNDNEGFSQGDNNIAHKTPKQALPDSFSYKKSICAHYLSLRKSPYKIDWCTSTKLVS